MANIKDVISKPGFSELTREQQLRALGKVDPTGFGMMKPSQQNKALDGALSLNQPKPEPDFMNPPLVSKEINATPFDDPLNPVSLVKDIIGVNRSYSIPLSDGKLQSLPETPIGRKREPSWTKRNVTDFVENTPLALLKDLSITDKTQMSSPAVGGLGGADIGELVLGPLWSIPRDVVGGIYGAGEKLVGGDPGAAIGQALTTFLPKLFGKASKIARGSAENSMLEALSPEKALEDRAKQLAPKMLDEYDSGAMSRGGLLEKLREQKVERLAQTKPIEAQLAKEPTIGYGPLDSVVDFMSEQGRIPVGEKAARFKAGGELLDTDVQKLLSGSPMFEDILNAKQGWADVDKAIFDIPKTYRDPGLTPKAEAARAAWGGAKTELEDIASQKGFKDYGSLNAELHDLIDIEGMIKRGERPGTFLGSLPNRVLGWLPSKIGARVFGGELASRVPSSIPFNTSSAYIKDILSKGLDPLARLTPEQMLILNNLNLEDESALQ